MSDATNGGQHNRQRPPRAPRGARRTRDKRLCQDMWVPTYLPNYTDQVGPVAVVIYMLLARACTYGWEPRWPSVAQLGTMAGVSRSTAERALRALRTIGLIETESCTDEAGQHSNYWDLTDPHDIRGKLDSLGPEGAGAPTSDGAPPSLVTGGDVIPDGGAPSPVKAPPLRSEGLKSVCEEEDTHTPGAARAPEDLGAAVVALTDLWCALLSTGAPGWRQAQCAEVAWQIAELLQRGWTAAELESSIRAPERDRREWPRVWAARHSVAALEVARKSAEGVRARLKLSEAAATQQAEVEARVKLFDAWEQLSSEEREAYEARALTARPELAARRGILKILAVDMWAADRGQLGAAASQ